MAYHLDLLSDLPKHAELIDGSLVFASPQCLFHTLAIDLLEDGLRRTVTPNLRVRYRMTVTLGERQRPEPDLLVVDALGANEPGRTTYLPKEVSLVVEVVSPDSMLRDRERKPQLYAKAGIMHFWRVEEVDGRPVVHVFELDPAIETYVANGVYHDRLQVPVPFRIDIDLTEIDRL